MLSVIIPAVGNVGLTMHCVNSVYRQSTGPIEIVLVDNGSDPEDSAQLQALPVEVYLGHQEMLGYPAAINRGVQASSGEWICLLNNDAWPTQDGWDQRLVGILEQVPEASMISPVTNHVANPDQRALGPSADRSQVHETPGLAFVCVVMSRALWDQIGGLDERFGLGNWEDNDFCHRVRLAGGRFLVDPAVFVHHVGNQTFRDLGYAELLESNRQIFMEKWQCPEDSLQSA